MIRRFLRNYLPRHRNRANQCLHAIGVPLTFIGTPVCLAAGKPWYAAIGCFVGGYVLQCAGHAIEGNDAGEVVFLKKLLGLPYAEYGPGANPSSLSKGDDDTSADSAQ
ncbi:MAG: Mpo1-like protein [Planctomycetaceae bacterium]